MRFSIRGRHVLGALAGIALLGPAAALAQAGGGSGSAPSSSSGGPGTLGTEVPNDSAVAQGYYHSRSRVGEDDRQLEEGIRQLLLDNRTAMEQAKQAAASGDPAAQEIVDAREIVEFNLLKGAQESGFDLGAGAEAGFAATGSMGADSSDLPSYATVESAAEATADASTDASSESMGSSEESMESSGSDAGLGVQDDASTADDLVQQARDANRHQLASLLEHAQKALDNAANATGASVGSASP